MSFLSKIFGEAVGSTVKEVSEGVASLATGIRTAITGIDPKVKGELEKFAQQAEHLGNQAQVELNKIEASRSSIFIAGWRPFIGWVCGFALAWHFIAQPLTSYLIALIATLVDGTPLYPPRLEIKDLISILLAMLGLSGMRSYEKKNNAQGNH